MNICKKRLGMSRFQLHVYLQRNIFVISSHGVKTICYNIDLFLLILTLHVSILRNTMYLGRNVSDFQKILKKTFLNQKFLKHYWVSHFLMNDFFNKKETNSNGINPSMHNADEWTNIL